MNKKLLICSLLATGLSLTACVKKESPQEDEQTQTETEQQVASEVQFQPLENTQAASEASNVTILREESSNSTTEIRREVREQPAESKPVAKPEPTKMENDIAQSTTSKSADEPQTEEDAVAAAIAAATPALAE